jgi:hypothetical protein
MAKMAKSMRAERRGRTLSGWVVGFDLSLSAPAAVALPLDWRPGDWARTRGSLVRPKAPKLDDFQGQLDRYHEIATWALGFLAPLCARGARVRTFVENYTYQRNQNAHAAGVKECGGVVKYSLYRERALVLTPVELNTARVTFFGKGNTPRGKGEVKIAVQVALDKARAPKSWEENTCDAFVVANHGLGIVGGTVLTLGA